MIELPYFSMRRRLARWHRKALEVVDKVIVGTLLMLIWLSVLIVLLGGR